MRGVKISQKDRDKIKSLRYQGFKVKEIAKRFNIAIYTTYDITKGIKPIEKRRI